MSKINKNKKIFFNSHQVVALVMLIAQGAIAEH